MNSKKILATIPRLELLNESDLDRVNKVIDACIIVQSLENMKSDNTQIKSFNK